MQFLGKAIDHPVHADSSLVPNPVYVVPEVGDKVDRTAEFERLPKEQEFSDEKVTEVRREVPESSLEVVCSREQGLQGVTTGLQRVRVSVGWLVLNCGR